MDRFETSLPFAGFFEIFDFYMTRQRVPFDYDLGIYRTSLLRVCQKKDDRVPLPRLALHIVIVSLSVLCSTRVLTHISNEDMMGARKEIVGSARVMDSLR